MHHIRLDSIVGCAVVLQSRGLQFKSNSKQLFWLKEFFFACSRGPIIGGNNKESNSNKKNGTGNEHH